MEAPKSRSFTPPKRSPPLGKGLGLVGRAMFLGGKADYSTGILVMFFNPETPSTSKRNTPVIASRNSSFALPTG
jgi:hypothetical protein